MSAAYANRRPRIWLWIAIAFLLGIVIGFVTCIVVLAIITAQISYAQ